MFLPAELRDWLLDSGFVGVTFYDGEGKRLTAQGRRIITMLLNTSRQLGAAIRPTSRFPAP